MKKTERREKPVHQFLKKKKKNVNCFKQKLNKNKPSLSPKTLLFKLTFLINYI